MQTMSILLIVFGLGVSTYGAYIIYRADYPRNDWILEALQSAASRPSYAVFAPDDYDPAAEKEQNFRRVQEVLQQSEVYASKGRKGMKAIAMGFAIQVLGNLMLLW